MMRALVVFIALFFWALPIFAVEPDEILTDPALENRARVISAMVRCVVCQNEPIDSSNADIARDLRLIIRERLLLGDSDDEVRAFLVARYGDYVLFKPPFRGDTLILWLAPFILFLIFLTTIVMGFRLRGGRSAPRALSEAEKRALSRRLDEDEGGS